MDHNKEYIEDIKISNKAKKICKEHYETQCGSCPIRPECTSHVGHGQEGFTRWVQAVNNAANSW